MMAVAHFTLAALLAWSVGSLGPLNWLLAALLLYPLIRLAGLASRPLRRYAQRIEAGVRFVPWFVYKVFSASLHVALIVLNPRRKIEPAVVRIHIETQDKRLITLIGCLLTLTPGTLALDYSEQGLYVHVLDARSVQPIQDGVSEIERRLMAWIRPNGGRV